MTEGAKPVSLSLEEMQNNVRQAAQTAANKKPTFVRRDFTMTMKSTEQANVADLISDLIVRNPFDAYKLKASAAILSDLQRLSSSSHETAVQVKRTVEVMERSRLKELPTMLTALFQAKEWVAAFGIFVKNTFPIVRHIDEVTRTRNASIKTGTELEMSYNTIDIPDQEKISLIDSEDNLAFFTRYHGLKGIDGKSYISRFLADIENEVDEHALEQELQILKNFAQSKSPAIRWAATIMQRELEARLCGRRSNASIGLMGKSTEVAIFHDTLFDSRCQNIFESNFPNFYACGLLYNSIVDYSSIGKAYLISPRFHKALLGMSEFCKQCDKEMVSVDERYRYLYDEYLSLSKKYGTSSENGPDLRATKPSLRLYYASGDTTPPQLPTPEEFSSISMNYGNPDTSLSHPPLPKEPTLKKEEGKKDNSNSTPLPSSAKKKNKHKARAARKKEEHAAASLSPSPSPTKNEPSSHSPSSEDSTPRNSPVPFMKPQPVETKANTSYASVAALPTKVETKENRGIVSSGLFEGQLKNIEYAERVMRWNTDPKAALARLKFKPHDPDEEFWKHATSAVDPFVGTAFSRRAKWNKKHDGYYIQAVVKWKKLENGQEPPKERQKEKQYRGFFRYAFDENGVLYHRDFGDKSNNQLFDALSNNRLFHEEDFPSLEEAHKDYLSGGKHAEAILRNAVSYTLNPDGTVTVVERTKDYILEARLYKKGKLGLLDGNHANAFAAVDA